MEDQLYPKQCKAMQILQEKPNNEIESSISAVRVFNVKTNRLMTIQ